MSFITTLALAMGSAWVSGINLYAAIATLGLLGRYAHLPLPGEMNALTNWWVIGVGLALYVIEFVADKVPLVDSVWDAVHTFIRVPAGAALAAAAFGNFDPGLQIIAFLLGGGLALSSHGTKATARAAINTSPEPFSNIAVSLVEDVIAIGSTLLAAYYPVLLIILVCLFVAISIFILPKIIRFLRGIFKRIRGAST
jgi:hypothetical protein